MTSSVEARGRFGETLVGLLLAAWVGAALLLAVSVAPAAFAVLPSRTLAGALVGRVLPILFYGGIASAILAVSVGARSRFRTAAGVIAGLSCAVAQWLITPRIEAIRASVDAAIETLAANDPMRVSFGRLHGISVVLLGVAMLSIGSILVQHLRRVSRG